MTDKETLIARMNEARIFIELTKTFTGISKLEMQLLAASDFLLSDIDRLHRTPEKLQCFMDMLLKEARKWSLKELMEDWNIDPEADYNEIKKWFKDHGIQF